MRTLREVVAFTGVTSDFGLYNGDPYRSTSLRGAAGMVPLLSPDERTHLRALITALARLPSITLTARLVGDSSGSAPYAPDIAVAPSGGVVIETSVNFFRSGQEIPGPAGPRELVDGSYDVPPDGGFAIQSFDDAGPYVATISRTGITSAGMTTLRQNLTFTVTGPESPTPPQPPPTPSPAQPTCAVEVDLTGFGSAAAAKVSGGGFLPSESVQVTLDGALGATVQANGLGGYDATIDFVETSPLSQHQVQARGVSSGRISNTAGFTG